jgi:phage regulator Rha-like protein
MNELVKSAESKKFISSREIAEATGKTPYNVMVDVRNMCEDAEIEITLIENSIEVNTEEVIVFVHEIEIEIGNGAKRKSKEYLLNEMAAELLATGYDVKRRLKVLQLIKKLKEAIENRKPLSQIELILQSAQILADLEKKQNDLESRMDIIEKNSADAKEQLFAFPEPTIEEASKSTRQTLVELINTVAYSDNIPHSVVWEKLYKEFSIRYHINVRLKASKMEMSQILWLERNGMIDELYAVATSIFKPTMKHTLKRRK